MRTSSTFAIVAVALFALSAAAAKRIAPRDVEPVTAGTTTYRVPHFGASHGQDQNGGFVQAWDARTRTLLWDRRVYRTVHDPGTEGDAQDVFITEIRVAGEKLLVTNEASERFEMDLASGRVRALTPLAGRRQVPEPEASPYAGGSPAPSPAPRAWTDEELLAYAASDYVKRDMMHKHEVLGTHNGVALVADFPCSDLCPANTVRIIHYQLGEGQQCSAAHGAKQDLPVPMGIGGGLKAFCVPKVLKGKNRR